jgi:hypothetical protein
MSYILVTSQRCICSSTVSLLKALVSNYFMILTLKHSDPSNLGSAAYHYLLREQTKAEPEVLESTTSYHFLAFFISGLSAPVHSFSNLTYLNLSWHVLWSCITCRQRQIPIPAACRSAGILYRQYQENRNLGGGSGSCFSIHSPIHRQKKYPRHIAQSRCIGGDLRCCRDDSVGIP